MSSNSSGEEKAGDFNAGGAMAGAATGAALGTAVPVVGNVVGAVGGALIGGFGGGLMGGGGGAGKAARERQEVAERMRAQSISAAYNTGSTVRDMAKASPMELRTMEQGLAASQSQLEQRQRLLEAVDPSIMEASKQILGILRGDMSGGAMSVYAQQRDKQRQMVLNQIRQRFGPGGESTAAGAKMLRDFDAQMNAAGVGVGQSQLQSLTGLAGSLNQMPGDLGGMATQNLGIAGVFKNRMIDAEKYAGTSLLNAMNGTSQNVVDTAGAQYLNSQIRSQQNQQLLNSGMQAVSMYAGMQRKSAPSGADNTPDMSRLNMNYAPNYEPGYDTYPMGGQSRKFTGNIA